MQRTVHTPDGRALALELTGDPHGKPVLVHMGTPNSRHLYGPNVADAQSRGLRLICYDRPGYGGSSPHPGHTIADCAGDVQAICEALGVQRLGVWGISGGGPHALACAAVPGDLVAAVASLASPAPYGAEGLDYFAGMGLENVEDFRLMHEDERAARAKLERDRERFLTVAASELGAEMASLLTPTDAAVLDGPFADYFALVHHEGLAPGGDGWWDDCVALQRQWGFDVADIDVSVLLLHGREDMFVPFDHGRWLAEHIPGVEARLFDHDGHLTLLANRVGEVHAWLAERL